MSNTEEVFVAVHKFANMPSKHKTVFLNELDAYKAVCHAIIYRMRNASYTDSIVNSFYEFLCVGDYKGAVDSFQSVANIIDPEEYVYVESLVVEELIQATVESTFNKFISERKQIIDGNESDLEKITVKSFLESWFEFHDYGRTVESYDKKIVDKVLEDAKSFSQEFMDVVAKYKYLDRKSTSVRYRFSLDRDADKVFTKKKV